MVRKSISRNSDYTKVHILCGVHGDEQHSVKACWEFYKRVKNENDSFNYVFYFFLNEGGCKNNTREFVESKEAKDLNRLFTRHESLEDIKTLISNIDNGIVLDVHSSPFCNNTVLIDYNNQSSLYYRIADKYDLNPMLRRTQNHGTIKKYFVDKNIPSFTLELGGMMACGDVTIDVDYIERAVKALQEINSGVLSADKLPANATLLTQQIYCPFKRAVITWVRALGEFDAYSKIATLEDMDTGETLEILAPGPLRVQDICGDIAFEGQAILEYSPNPEGIK